MPAHGTRHSYAAGCHCTPCRAANAAYVAAHRTPAGLVDADAARVHLQTLAAAGVGYRQAARLAGLPPSFVHRLRAGTVDQLRPTTAARILAVRPLLARGALVPATRTWRTVDSLSRDGFTRREIAFHFGAHSQQLQLARKRVRVTSALRMAALYAHLAG